MVDMATPFASSNTKRTPAWGNPASGRSGLQVPALPNAGLKPGAALLCAASPQIVAVADDNRGAHQYSQAKPISRWFASCATPFLQAIPHSVLKMMSWHVQLQLEKSYLPDLGRPCRRKRIAGTTSRRPGRRTGSWPPVEWVPAAHRHHVVPQPAFLQEQNHAPDSGWCKSRRKAPQSTPAGSARAAAHPRRQRGRRSVCPPQKRTPMEALITPEKIATINP